MLVKKIMSKRVITVSPESSLKEVGEILKEKRISGLPVVDSGGGIVGIITLTDMLNILNRLYKWKELEKAESGLKLSNLFEKEKREAKVRDFMSKNVFVLSENDTIEVVMELMFNKGVHTLPVADKGKIVGVVGRRDLIRACF